VKYNVATAPPPKPKALVSYGQDITFLAWKIEGANSPLSYTWRELAQANGIFDPMQYAGESGRTILGNTISPGKTLTLP